jgi:hypothetical protein
MPTYWRFGLVVATLYTLLNVLVRFDATCRLEMILGSFFCDCEEVRLNISVRATLWSFASKGPISFLDAHPPLF